jgi:deoxyribodipyrimidine photo-lyase
MSVKSVLVWFRQDLRLADHPALSAASKKGTVIPVFIWDKSEGEQWNRGSASRWWLHFSLSALAKSLEERGSRLILRTGLAEDILPQLLAETGAQEIFASKRYEPNLAAKDQNLAQKFCLRLYAGTLLSEPGEVLNGSGLPYKVFTPYWRACNQQLNIQAPLPAPEQLPNVAAEIKSIQLQDLGLLPIQNWDQAMRKHWQVGESEAHKKLKLWIKGPISGYPENRNIPGLKGTSQLSPHLHLGEITPRQIWWSIQIDALTQDAKARQTYLSEIGWREFAYQILHHFPTTDLQPLDSRFEIFPWRQDAIALNAWQSGRTGYPIVDAGMRELWALGWMHNRVRMIVASFLSKDLLLPWQMGAKWFWDTLVDADLAINSLNWQWTAGCGADAAPYFRIFNPVTQSQKFDSKGEYIRKWVPELQDLPDKWIHQPWLAPALVLKAAGVNLGEDYPEPIVEHKSAREAALLAFAGIKTHK